MAVFDLRRKDMKNQHSLVSKCRKLVVVSERLPKQQDFFVYLPHRCEGYRRCFHLWSVLAVLSVAMMTHCSARTAETPRYGVNLFLARRYSPQEYPRVFKALEEANISFVREEVSLQEVFREDHADFSRYDAAFKALRRRGIYPLILLADPPKSWTNENLAARIVAAVSHFRRYSAHFQILNEVNTPRFWGGPPDPHGYAALMKTVFPALKQRFPNVTLISAGLASPDLPYLKAALEANLAEYVDAFAVHPYTFPLPFRDIAADLVVDFTKMVSPKPVWVTELGWPTGGGAREVDPNQQAMFLEEAWMRLSLIPEIRGIFWYELRDAHNPGEGEEGKFGLLHFDFEAKPSYQTLKSRFTAKSGLPVMLEDIIEEKPETFLPSGFEIEVDLSGVVPGAGNAVAVELKEPAVMERGGNCAIASVKLEPAGSMLGFYLKDRSGEVFTGTIERVVWEGEREISWPLFYRHEKNFRPIYPLSFAGFLIQPVSLYSPSSSQKVRLSVRNLRFCVETSTVRILAPVR